MGQDMMRLRVVRPHPGPGDGSGVQNPRRFPPGSWSATRPEPESATEQEPRPKESLDPTELERFERTFLPHMRAAYNLARWLTRSDQDAEDAVQEAYLRAVRFFGGFRGGDGRAWLLTIVRNACYTGRQPGRLQESTIPFDEEIHDVEDEALGPEDLLLQKASRRALVQAPEDLPVEFREALVLRELEGLSYKEMAEVTHRNSDVAPGPCPQEAAAMSPGADGRRPGVSCRENAARLLEAYVDGQLDLVTSLEMERHLSECEECSEAMKSRRALRSALGGASLYFEEPKHLEGRVRAELRKAAGPSKTARPSRWRWLAAAATLPSMAILAGALMVMSRTRRTAIG